MKTNVKVLLAALCAFAVLGSQQVAAEVVYFTPRQVLQELFPKSEKVSYVKFAPSRKQRAELERRLRQKLARESYVFYIATTGGRVDGYAFIGNEMGQHFPITFAVQLSPQGVVQRQEVMVYRERWGGEIRDPRFRAQFRGKTATDPIQPGNDVDIISGATISCHSIANGVRRALALFAASGLGEGGAAR